MNYLLDSVILIDHFNNIPEASAFIQNHHGQIVISAITRAEVLTGFKTAPHKRLAIRLLNQFQLIPISQDEADLAADLRQKERWKLPDAFQAAVAKLHHLKLVTRNTKDFNPKKYSFVHIPYEI